MSSSVHTTSGTIQTLQDQIQKNLVKSTSQHFFLPTDRLHKIFTFEAIESAVEELNCDPEDYIKLADTIHKKGKRVFAMLIRGDCPQFITKFREHEVLDSKLPLNESDVRAIGDFQKGPQLVQELQWTFFPYSFPENMFENHCQVEDSMIMPLTAAENTGHGASAHVKKISISSSQQNFISTKEEVVQVAQKELKEGESIEAFQKEMKCLRLLNQLRHPNIITLYGSYTHLGKHNFLFPFIDMNLHKFLLSIPRHQDFQWDFTFYSALAGLASALAKTHRLQLNQADHDVNFNAIGYHRDLRPPNILVSSDNFILADFGLGQLKLAEALSHTPHADNHGDYAAPECTDLEDNPQNVNRAIDVWAFGCLVTEVVTYMLKGADDLERFREKRKGPGRRYMWRDCVFYEPQGQVKQQVLEWLNLLIRENSQQGLVVQLIELSLQALQPDPQRRPDMDIMYDRLATLSLHKHFKSVKDMFHRVLEEIQRSTLPLDRHLSILHYSQQKFELWGDILTLGEKADSACLCDHRERAVSTMKELFQDLRNISEKENSDGQAASSSYKHLVKNVQHLQSLLPEDLQSQAEDRWAEVYSEFDDEQMQDVHASPVVAHARTLESGFEEAAQKFKNSLPNSIPLDEILKVISSDDFHDITDRIQAEQGDRNELRNLAKIGLYVERLTGYISIIDGIIDGNSGILALLWGPIAFLLQLAEISGNVYDSLIGAFVEVGEILPDFQASASMLEGNNDAREITVLFFKDLLDIYREALEPFSRHNWLHLFDYLWPKHHANISRIVGHIERLARLMGTEICIEHIHQEQEFRKSALQSFKEQQRKMRRQEYHRILTFFNPGRYDKTLYHLDVLRCQETGTWLNNDHIFTQWFERSEGGAQTLWLRGIPGAGKTVLCSAIIRRFTHMQAKTAFVFITYGDNEISALSTIYSLVFQLAEGDEEAMDIVCGSGCEGSSSDLTAAGNLLCTLVKHCITPVYLVIDGLDEISKSERGRLITELLRQAEMCKELRIILSSRPESDLMHLLNNKTAMIQVHDHNMGSIKNYINERCQHIFQTHRIYPDAETEFRQILAPLADRAGGMFLYAKLVMGMVETMHDLSEMREELKILPKSLDAAYHRIIVRSVRHKDGRRAEKAHLLLGWIACSSVSITIEEAQQALAIRPSNPDQVFTPAVKLDVVDILGPIVEVVDNGIRFVHFTAKEYISSPHLGTDLIDTTKATLELAMRCIDYLCQRHHDPDLSSEERSEKVCTGQYGFHAFATKMWFELVRQYFQLTKPEDPPVELIGSIQMLWRVRGRGAESQNESEEKDKDETRGNTNNEAVFESLGAKQPALYQILCRVSWFRDWSFLFTGSVNKESHKDINDPFTISDTSRLIQQAFNDTLCRSPKGWLTSGKPGCHKNCARILDYYGERPFKCGFPQCNFWRYGFWDLRSRDEHKRSHDKPIKCDVPGCEFGFIGFSSERTRNNHLQKFHQSDPPPRSFDTNNIPSDEIQDILLDFVKSNQVEAVKEALGVFQDALQDDIFRDELMKLAASEASEAMLQLLADPADFQEGEPVSQRVTIYLKESIKARNENTLRYFLDKLRPIIRGKEGSFGRDIEDHVTGILPIPTLLLSQWFDGVKIWSDWFRRGLLVSPGPIENVVETKIRHRFDDDNTIRAAASHPTGDEQLIYLWEHSGVLSVIKSIPKWTSQTLRKVAGSGFSIPLAKWLLKNGACVNEELVRDTNASALQRAAKSTSPEAAEMMQFLLQNGADPYASMRGRHGRKQKKICEEDGAKGIQKHTGMTWDEFIKANSCEVIERDC